MTTPRAKTPRIITERDRARGRRIAQARTKKELTQVQLADIVGVSVGLAGQWETGATTLTPQKAEKLAEALGVSMAWLLTGDDESERMTAQTEPEQKMLEIFRLIPADRQSDLAALVEQAAKMMTKK